MIWSHILQDPSTTVNFLLWEEVCMLLFNIIFELENLKFLQYLMA